MGELVQLDAFRKKKQAPKTAPESEPFASKCMEYLYSSLGYAHAVDGGSMQNAYIDATFVKSGNAPVLSAEQALHDDICDAIRAYAVEALHPSPLRHEILQRKHIDDVTGLVNQLLQRKDESAEIELPQMREVLKQAVRDASLFYYGTNIFAGKSNER